MPLSTSFRGAGAPTAGGANKPSILFLTSELPWPLNCGGHLRTFHLVRALAARYRVYLMAAVSPEQETAIAPLLEHDIRVVPAFTPPRVRWRECGRAVQAALGQEPYVFYNRHNRPEVAAVLRDFLRREAVDLVYLDHLDPMVFEKLLPRVPMVVDLHNVYSTLAQRAADEHSSRIVRFYLRREARLLHSMERRAAQAAAILFTVSDEDRRHFGALGANATCLVPNGVDCAAYDHIAASRRDSAPLILYLGTMSWSPNVMAALFLARTVLPQVRAHFPAARLRVVGRNPPRQVQELNGLPGIEVTGAVPDVNPHLSEAGLLAVPLEAGGGTRLKILEAFAAGLPVVSTPLGCEGLRVAHGEHLVIADHAHFAEGVLTVLKDQPLAEGMAARARGLVRDHYDWRSIGEVACQAIDGVLHGAGWDGRSAGRQMAESNTAPEREGEPIYA